MTEYLDPIKIYYATSLACTLSLGFRALRIQTVYLTMKCSHENVKMPIKTPPHWTVRGVGKEKNDGVVPKELASLQVVP